MYRYKNNLQKSLVLNSSVQIVIWLKPRKENGWSKQIISQFITGKCFSGGPKSVSEAKQPLDEDKRLRQRPKLRSWFAWANHEFVLKWFREEVGQSFGPGKPIREKLEMHLGRTLNLTQRGFLTFLYNLNDQQYRGIIWAHDSLSIIKCITNWTNRTAISEQFSIENV